MSQVHSVVVYALLATNFVAVRSEEVVMTWNIVSGTRNETLQFPRSKFNQLSVCLCTTTTEHCTIVPYGGSVMYVKHTSAADVTQLYKSTYICTLTDSPELGLIVICTRLALTLCADPLSCWSYRINYNNEPCALGQVKITWDSTQQFEWTHNSTSITVTPCTLPTCPSVPPPHGTTLLPSQSSGDVTTQLSLGATTTSLSCLKPCTSTSESPTSTSATTEATTNSSYPKPSTSTTEAPASTSATTEATTNSSYPEPCTSTSESPVSTSATTEATTNSSYPEPCSSTSESSASTTETTPATNQTASGLDDGTSRDDDGNTATIIGVIVAVVVCAALVAVGLIWWCRNKTRKAGKYEIPTLEIVHGIGTRTDGQSGHHGSDISYVNVPAGHTNGTNPSYYNLRNGEAYVGNIYTSNYETTDDVASTEVIRGNDVNVRRPGQGVDYYEKPVTAKIGHAEY